MNTEEFPGTFCREVGLSKADITSGNIKEIPPGTVKNGVVIELIKFNTGIKSNVADWLCSLQSGWINVHIDTLRNRVVRAYKAHKEVTRRGYRKNAFFKSIEHFHNALFDPGRIRDKDTLVENEDKGKMDDHVPKQRIELSDCPGPFCQEIGLTKDSVHSGNIKEIPDGSIKNGVVVELVKFNKGKKSNVAEWVSLLLPNLIRLVSITNLRGYVERAYKKHKKSVKGHCRQFKSGLEFDNTMFAEEAMKKLEPDIPIPLICQYSYRRYRVNSMSKARQQARSEIKRDIRNKVVSVFAARGSFNNAFVVKSFYNQDVRFVRQILCDKVGLLNSRMKAHVFDAKISVIVKRAETLKQKGEVIEYKRFMNAESNLVNILQKGLAPYKQNMDFSPNALLSNNLNSSKNLENEGNYTSDIYAKECVEDAKQASEICFYHEPQATEANVEVDDWVFVQTKSEIEDTTYGNYMESANDENKVPMSTLTNSEYNQSTEVDMDVDGWACVKTKIEAADTAVHENYTSIIRINHRKTVEDSASDETYSVIRNSDDEEETCSFANTENKLEFVAIHETDQNIHKDQNRDMTNCNETIQTFSAENVTMEENDQDSAHPKHDSHSLISVFCEGKLVEIINEDTCNNNSHGDKGVVRNENLYESQSESDIPQMVEQEPM